MQAAGQMQVQQIVQTIQTNLTEIAHQEAHHQNAHTAAALNVVLPTNLLVTVQNAHHQTGLTARVLIAAALTSHLATGHHAVRHQAGHIAAALRAVVLTAHPVVALTDHTAADLSVAKVAATGQQEIARHVVDLTDQLATDLTANHL